MRWADELYKFTLPAVRATFRPADFATRMHVRLIVGEHVAHVAIVSSESTAFGGRRRWLQCPRVGCGRKTSVVAFDPLGGLWGCYACLRPRSRPCLAKAPHMHSNVRVENADLETKR